MTKTITYYGHEIIRKEDKVTLRIGTHVTIDIPSVNKALEFIDDMMLQRLKSIASQATKAMGVGNDWQIKTDLSYSEGDRRTSRSSEGLPTVLYHFEIREECLIGYLHFDEMQVYLRGLKHGAETTKCLRRETA